MSLLQNIEHYPLKRVIVENWKDNGVFSIRFVGLRMNSSHLTIVLRLLLVMPYIYKQVQGKMQIIYGKTVQKPDCNTKLTKVQS